MPIKQIVQTPSPLLPSTQAVSATSAILAWSSVVEIGATALTANITLTLPPATADLVGKSIVFRRLDGASFTVTVVAPSGQTTELANPLVLNYQKGAIRVSVVSAGRSVQTEDLNTRNVAFGAFVGSNFLAPGISGLVPAPPVSSLSQFLLAGGGFGRALINQRVLSASGTYTPSPGTTRILAMLCGGGGGGGAVNAGTMQAAGGGGGGGTRVFWETVSDATNYALTIGAGGASATAGGNSQITINGQVYQGNGGTSGAASTTTNTIVRTYPGGDGGIASGGTNAYTIPGYNGRQAVILSTTSLLSGAGGNSFFGLAGGMRSTQAAITYAGLAAPALNYGAGGGGALSLQSAANAGGQGMGGVFIVYEYR